MKEASVTQYTTTDGEVFLDKKDALFHKITLDAEKSIGDYIGVCTDDEGKPLSQRATTHRTNIILAWEQYKAVRDMNNVTSLNVAG